MQNGNQPIKVILGTESVIKAIIIVLLLVFLFYLRDLVLVVLTAVVLASSVEPLTRWFEKRGASRVISVLGIYLSFVGIFAGVFYFFVPIFLAETTEFLQSVPRYIDSVALWNPLQKNDIVRSKETALNLSNDISIASREVRGGLTEGFSLGGFTESLSKTVSEVSGGLLKTISFVFGGVFSIALIVILSFYLAVQKDGVGEFLRIITPLRHEAYVIDLWNRSRLKIGLWMQGQFLLAVLVGVLVYLGLMIFGVKNALLLAFLAALFETIPLFGPILASVPAIIIAYSTGGLSLGLIVAGLYIIIQQFENHLIYPLVVKKIVGVPPILVILALIVGGKLAGFLGILLSVPVAATLMECLYDLEKRKLSGRQV